jgi:hypothetical protein
MADLPVIDPANPQAPPPDQSAQQPPPQAPEAPPAAPEAPPLPPALLKVPAIQALVAGAPPALSMRLKGSEDREEVKLVTKNAQGLQQAGMGFYQSLNKEFGVMFNALRIHPDDLLAADKQGQLLKVAPDFDAVNHAVSKMGKDHPALHASPPPAAYASPVSAGSAPQMASGKYMPPVAAAVARKLLQSRIQNMQPSAPTGGPMPGAGMIANQVAKGVI